MTASPLNQPRRQMAPSAIGGSEAAVSCDPSDARIAAGLERNQKHDGDSAETPLTVLLPFPSRSHEPRLRPCRDSCFWAIASARRDREIVSSARLILVISKRVSDLCGSARRLLASRGPANASRRPSPAIAAERQFGPRRDQDRTRAYPESACPDLGQLLLARRRDPSVGGKRTVRVPSIVEAIVSVGRRWRSLPWQRTRTGSGRRVTQSNRVLGGCRATKGIVSVHDRPHVNAAARLAEGGMDHAGATPAGGSNLNRRQGVNPQPALTGPVGPGAKMPLRQRTERAMDLGLDRRTAAGGRIRVTAPRQWAPQPRTRGNANAIRADARRCMRHWRWGARGGSRATVGNARSDSHSAHLFTKRELWAPTSLTRWLNGERALWPSPFLRSFASRVGARRRRRSRRPPPPRPPRGARRASRARGPSSRSATRFHAAQTATARRTHRFPRTGSPRSRVTPSRQPTTRWLALPPRLYFNSSSPTTP
jgi:hypothetical protein